jgi:hypothetical protein
VQLSRAPLYGIGERAAQFDPETLGFADAQLPSLKDDRVGRRLERLCQSDIIALLLTLVTYVIQEFHVDLDKLHNDSTTITSHSADANSDAAEKEKRGPKTRLAITWGYNKDHWPELKRLRYILFHYSHSEQQCRAVGMTVVQA